MAHQSQLIEQDILAYLKQQEEKILVKCLTCGSVDDGKSTLIGRLLHDSKMIFEDQLLQIAKDSKKVGTTGEEVDLALLVDGLQSEREQGITIDVAYRYFSTDKRKFILADTPGHEQYTRNMATGASNCDMAIILIDARNGVQLQTRRHSFICTLLGIKHLLVAVNKMDLVDHDQSVFDGICRQYQDFAQSLGVTDVTFVPISALKGDNVVSPSATMPWYQGPPLMTILESCEVDRQAEQKPFRFQVQYVNRPDSQFRGYAGTISSGSIAVGDPVLALPSGVTTKVAAIVDFDGEMKSAFAPQAVTLTLIDDIDLSRGEMLVKPDAQPFSAQALSADVVWMHGSALQIGREYFIKHGCKSTSAHVSKIDYKVDVNTMSHHQTDELQLNEIGRCCFEMSEALHFDPYDDNPASGAFIIIDRLSNVTVGAGMIVGKVNSQGIKAMPEQFSEFELELNALIRKHFPHWEAKDLSSLVKKD